MSVLCKNYNIGIHLSIVCRTKKKSKFSTSLIRGKIFFSYFIFVNKKANFKVLNLFDLCIMQAYDVQQTTLLQILTLIELNFIFQLFKLKINYYKFIIVIIFHLLLSYQ